ncbi:MAG: signal peptide peptidase SppA [Peptoniphilaceae bacterium]|nr:signal peptide peptidase SppA [Peptoniphilaceae bacterium]MDD7382766.1 signal peptide peptidase SppA [Peptoniphilaceae bacterium]MDY3737922.1 signal peptide peptidase SppA [Peptoniphilaceae bacterium]
MEENKNRNIKKRIAFAFFVIIVFASILGEKNEESKNEDAKNWIYDNLDSYINSKENVISGTNPSQKILVVDVKGTIASNSNYEDFMKYTKNALNDDRIKALILRVDSPGGTVYASEQISKRIKKIKKARNIPVYTVMESMAASGGYYISAATDKIFASNETWTGSIGVIMSTYNFKGLFEKYGIKQVNFTSGKLKDMLASGKEISKEDEEVALSLVNSAYERFVKVVSEGRNMSEKDVKKLADGRIYDGSQAVKNGLVDEIGDFDDAVNELTESLNLVDPTVFEYSNPSNYLTDLFSKVGEFKNNSELSILNNFFEKSKKSPQIMYYYGE